MALVRYYKFNDSLFDASGYGFDLVTRYGSPTFVPGKLNYGAQAGYTGMYGLQWGAGATGAAANAVISANSSEATSGVSDWSLAFWVRIDDASYSQTILSLLSGTGTGPITITYDAKTGTIQVNGSTFAVSGSTWYFVCLRKTSSSIYASLNAGSETTIAGTAGANQFNEITVGTNTYYGQNYFTIDDLRIFNTLLSTGDRNAIYNAGSPSEASTTTPTAWQAPIHQHKLNGTLADSIGSVTATTTSGGYLGSGLFSASSNAVRLSASGDDLTAYDASFGGTALTSGSFSFFCWYLAGSYYSAYPPLSFSCGPISHVMSFKTPSTTFNGNTVTDTNGASSSICLYVYNDIHQRLTVYGFDGSSSVKVLAEIAAARPAGSITGWSFSNGVDMMAAATSDIDEVRFYQTALTGLDMVQLFNGGTGTESATGGTVNASASGALATITLAVVNGTATGSATRSAGLATITAFNPSGTSTGSAAKPAGLATITASGLSGSASAGGGTSASASGLLATVTMSAQAGIANGTISVTASGGLGTVTVTAPLVPPKYLWKFQDTLTDSLRSKSLLATGNYTFESNPWSAANLGRSLKITSADNSTNNQVEMHASLTGTEFDSSNFANLSWTCCFWLKNPHQQVFYTPPYELFAYFNFAILNTQLSITRNLLSNNPATEFRVIWTSTAAGQTTTYLQQYNQPNKTQAAPDWFALTYDKVSGTFEVYTAAGGTITQAYSGTFATSSYRWNIPSYDLQFFHGWSLTPNQGNYIATGMDDLRLYDSALTAGELATIYNGGAGSVLPANGSASGALGTVTVYSVSGVAYSTAGGPLGTVTLYTWNGAAAGTTSATATGTLPQVSIGAPAGSATGTAGGPLGTVTIFPITGAATYQPEGRFTYVLTTSGPSGIATGGAVTSGALSTATATAQAGTAAGSGQGTGALGTATASGLAGTAAGATAATGALASIVSSAFSGAGTGAATTSGALAAVTANSLAGAATGTAAGTGSWAAVQVTTQAGAATGTAAGTATAGTITANSLTGSATGAGITISPFVTVTLTAPSATATGTRTVQAFGAFAPITASTFEGAGTGTATKSAGLATIATNSLAGNGSGSAITAGGLATITANSLTGSGFVSTFATGTLTTITTTAPTGSATGTGLATGGLASVTLTAPAGQATVSIVAIGALAAITTTTPAGSAIASATGSSLGPVVRVLAFSATSASSAAASRVSLIQTDIQKIGAQP